MLTVDDLPLLRKREFIAGPTGHAWYGEDIFGDTWRAYADDSSDRLLFSVEVTATTWGPTKPMNREDFDELFRPRPDSF